MKQKFNHAYSVGFQLNTTETRPSSVPAEEMKRAILLRAISMGDNEVHEACDCFDTIEDDLPQSPVSKVAAIKAIRLLMAEHNLAVVTTCNAVTEDKLLCDPIIWQKDDLEWRGSAGASIDENFEAWGQTRAYKTLSERSTEEGWEILDCLLEDALKEVNNG